jgi:thioredoxin
MEIGEQEFNKRIADGGKFVADFFASWCNPCQKFAPIFAKAAEAAKKQNSAVDFVKIDVDNCPEVAEKYGIRSVPTIILFDKGAVVSTHIGTFGAPDEVLAFASQ